MSPSRPHGVPGSLDVYRFLRRELGSTYLQFIPIVAIDTAYQLRVLGRFYPGEAFGFALLLGFVPYLLFRGPADRVVRWLSAHRRLQ